MRIVLCDEELEPLTILELPHWRRLNLPHGSPITIAIEPPTWPEFSTCSTEFSELRVETVTIRFEKFWRRSGGHEARSWIAFTHDTTSALKLRAAFLPGQQATLQQREREVFARGFLRGVATAIGRYT